MRQSGGEGRTWVRLDLLLHDVLQLADRGFQTFVAAFAHSWVQNCLFIIQDGQNVGPVNNGPARKEPQAQHCLHWVLKNSAGEWELKWQRQAFIPLSELVIKLCNNGFQARRGCHRIFGIYELAHSIEKAPERDLGKKV